MHIITIFAIAILAATIVPAYLVTEKPDKQGIAWCQAVGVVFIILDLVLFNPCPC